MRFLVLQAYLKLIQFDLYLARGNFAAFTARSAAIQWRTRPPISDVVKQHL